MSLVSPRPNGQVLLTAGPSPQFPGHYAGPQDYSHTSAFFQEVVLPGIDAYLKVVFEADDAARRFAFDFGATGLQEAVLRQLARPGEAPIGVGKNGAFGDRWQNFGTDLGFDVKTFEAARGTPLSPAVLEKFLDDNPAVQIVYIVAADTSIGIGNPVEQLAASFRKKRGDNGLFVVDCVLDVGGRPFEFDAWRVDVAVASMAKCLGGPTNVGIAAISKKAEARMLEVGENVGSPVLGLVKWWKMRAAGKFHHTNGVDQTIATYQTLDYLLGGKMGWMRGRAAMQQLRSQLARLNRALISGLEAMGAFNSGFGYMVEDRFCRLPQLSVLTLPNWLPAAGEELIRADLESKHRIYIGGGLGDLKGKIWRIGTMGALTIEDVVYFLECLENIIAVKPGIVCNQAQAAAMNAYNDPGDD